jgi:hypothetical protein
MTHYVIARAYTRDENVPGPWLVAIEVNDLLVEWIRELQVIVSWLKKAHMMVNRLSVWSNWPVFYPDDYWTFDPTPSGALRDFLGEVELHPQLDDSCTLPISEDMYWLIRKEATRTDGMTLEIEGKDFYWSGYMHNTNIKVETGWLTLDMLR